MRSLLRRRVVRVHAKAGILVALCCPHVMMDLVIAGSEQD